MTLKGQEGKKVKSTIFNNKYKKSDMQNNENVTDYVREREVIYNNDSLRDNKYENIKD